MPSPPLQAFALLSSPGGDGRAGSVHESLLRAYVSTVALILLSQLLLALYSGRLLRRTFDEMIAKARSRRNHGSAPDVRSGGRTLTLADPNSNLMLTLIQYKS